MTFEQQTIEAQSQTIQAQSKLISFLEAEVERLKNRVFVGPNTPTSPPTYTPITPNPFIVPYQPQTSPTPWLQPLYGPYITGDSLPAGSVKWNTQNNPPGSVVINGNVPNYATTITTLTGDVTTASTNQCVSAWKNTSESDASLS